MRLGAHHPVADKCAWPEIIPQVAVEAERIRLDSVWSGPRVLRGPVLSHALHLGWAAAGVIAAEKVDH